MRPQQGGGEVRAETATPYHHRWIQEEMIFVPPYVVLLIPILAMWWTHRRVERKEYKILHISLAAICMPLAVLAWFRPMTCTTYHGPLAASGIKTFQIPLAIFATALLTMIPIRMRFLRGFIAILAGEVILGMIIWIS